MHNLTKIKLFRILLYISYPISLIVLLPFALLKKKNPSGLFFFFDRYVIGGAQRIHLEILSGIPDIYKQIYFTRLSPNDKFKKEFYSLPNAHCKDIHFWCDNLLIRLFTTHYYAFYINRHKAAHVFSSNSTFFYDMLPFLNKEIIKTELLHNFTHGKSGMEFFGLANHAYLTNRVVYDFYTLSNIKKQYKEYNVPERYYNHIQFIDPGVPIPGKQEKLFAPPLKVLYAGRGGEQKRIHLLDKIVDTLIREKAPIEFHFAGTMMDELSDFVKQHSVIHGAISGQQDMYTLYRQCDVLLMTSAYEGFPMFIKEGMANSCVPVVTALEGNSTHLTHNENALLIDQVENEGHVINKAIELLIQLANNPDDLSRLSAAAYTYAFAHFDAQVFRKKYHSFFADGTRYPAF
jgi:glycosyltransferase involved in cell wall biosynthesis